MTDKGWKFTGNERKYLDDVLKSGFGASESGTMNERLENLFADIHNKKFAITANSGTSTLHMALYSFGVGPGDEVLIPSLTVGMCGFAVWQSGATPIFVDVLPDTFLMDPKDLKKKISKNSKAVMPVHMYGNVCDMESIMEIANENNLYVVEDSAECFLGLDNKSRIAGTIGHVGSWSFEGSKHVTTSEGGIVLTDDEEIAIKMRQFGGVGFKNITAQSGKVRISRDNFQDPNWERHNIFAYNYRMPELCAAVGLAQCERLEKFVELRVTMAQQYMEIITDSELFSPQKTQEGFKNTYWTFAAKFLGDKFNIEWQEFRKKYIEFGGDGIYAAHQLVYNEPCFKNYYESGNTPVAEDLQKRLMLFTTNQKDESERMIQINALEKTLKFFK
jgi:perosamine synthetase